MNEQNSVSVEQVITESIINNDNNTIQHTKNTETIVTPVKKKRQWLSEKGLNTLTMVIASTLLTFVCLSPLLYLMNKKIPKPMGVIDLQALVNENQNAIVNTFSNSTEISEEQRADAMKKTQDFAIKLNKAVADKAIECGCVLVNKAAVLTEQQDGVIVDYTDKIRQEVK